MLAAMQSTDTNVCGTTSSEQNVQRCASVTHLDPESDEAYVECVQLHGRLQNLEVRGFSRHQVLTRGWLCVRLGSWCFRHRHLKVLALFIGHSVLLSTDKSVAVMEHNSPAFLSNYRHTLKYQFLTMLKYAFFLYV